MQVLSLCWGPRIALISRRRRPTRVVLAVHIATCCLLKPRVRMPKDVAREKRTMQTKKKHTTAQTRWPSFSPRCPDLDSPGQTLSAAQQRSKMPKRHHGVDRAS